MDYIIRESQYKKVCHRYLNSLRMKKFVSKKGDVICFKYSENDELCQLNIHIFGKKKHKEGICFINKFFIDGHDKIFSYHYDPHPFIISWVEEQLDGVKIGTVSEIDPNHQSYYRLKISDYNREDT